MIQGFTREELEEAGLLDFRVFLIQVWAYLGLPDPTPVQLDIAKSLQHAPRRFILQAFRGVGKSWITVAFVLWNLLLNPQMKIMVVSANQNLADDFSKFCKQLIHGMPLLQHLAPGEGQKDSGIKFDVGPATESKDPSVKSVGIDGQLTGSRADLIIGDDVEVVKNALTHLLRERLSEKVKEFDAVLKPGGRVVYLGTPQTEASLYNRLAADRGYSITIWPAEIPKRASVYNGRLAAFVQARIDAGWAPGVPLDPRRFNAEDLAERRMSYGAAGYALQFLLDTSPADADKHPLKLSDLTVMDVDRDVAPVKVVWSREKAAEYLQSGGLDGDVYYQAAWRSDERASYQGTVMAIDPSGMGSDETAYAIVKFCHGQLYWISSGGFTDGFGEDTLRMLAARAAAYGVTDVICETNYGGGMFNNLLAPHLAKYGITNINPDDWNGWSRGQKEMRLLDILEPVFKSHRLVVDRQVIEDDLKQQSENFQYSVVYQITRLARIKGCLPHDDRVEALAMACDYWTARMNRDKEQALIKHKEALLDTELRNFMRHATGNTSGWTGYRYAGRRTT